MAAPRGAGEAGDEGGSQVTQAQQIEALTVDIDGPRWHRLRGPDREEYGVMVRILCRGVPVWSRFVGGYARFDPRRRNRLGEYGAYVSVPPPKGAVEEAVEQAERLSRRYQPMAPGAVVEVPVTIGRGRGRWVRGVVESLHIGDGRAVVQVQWPDELAELWPDDRRTVPLSQVRPVAGGAHNG